MVNVTAINAFIHDVATREAMRMLSHFGEDPSYFSEGGTYENREEEKIKNPMRGIEDMVEQNDNNFDGVINNLPEPKPVTQVDSEDVIEEVQKKKSVLEKIRENAPDPEKIKPMSLCPDRELC